MVQVKRVFALARPGLLEAIQPEIQALFRAVIYAFSIWVNKQTPGNVFMNLLFVDGSSSIESQRPRYAVRMYTMTKNIHSCHRNTACPDIGHRELSSVLNHGTGHARLDDKRSLTRRQRALHAVLFVVLPWLTARAEHAMAKGQWGARPRTDWRHRLWLATVRARNTYQVLSTLNYLVFVRFGRFVLL